jgi:hypothetical protein
MATEALIPLGVDPIGAMDATVVMTCETIATIFYVVSVGR